MKNTVLLCTKFGMGQTNIETLNQKLIVKFFNLLLESSDLPAAVCFYTDGVRLVTDDSPVLDQLAQLEKKGVRLIICSTCIDEMGIAKEQIKVGIVGGMPDIIEAMTRAEKVITL